MINGIDLLVGEREKRLKQEKNAAKTRVYALLIVLGVILLTAGAYAYAIFLQKNTNYLADQLTVKRTAINELKNLEGLQIVLVQRLNYLDKLLAQKDNNYYLLLDLLQKIMPADVALVKLSQKDKLVSLSVSAKDDQAFDAFMTVFNQEIDQKNSPFSQRIEIASLNRADDGIYDLVINLADSLANETQKQ